MDKITINKLIQLNKDFYQRIGAEFSRTRRSYWYGWLKLNGIFKTQLEGYDQVRVLDLGCGNGRFYKFIKEIFPVTKLFYTGIDADQKLLEEASSLYSNKENEFLQKDFFADMNLEGKYDVVTAFGVAHHIPSREYRLEWFTKISSLVNEGGFLVFTTWEFDLKKNFSPDAKSLPDRGIAETDLEEGDYFIGWNNLPGVFRYSHIYSLDEIADINIMLESNGFKLLESYLEDGISRNLNKYFVYVKLELL